MSSVARNCHHDNNDHRVARLVVEIRSDGSRTIARGTIEDVATGQRSTLDARGDSLLQLAIQLARALTQLPRLGARSRGARVARPGVRAATCRLWHAIVTMTIRIIASLGCDWLVGSRPPTVRAMKLAILAALCVVATTSRARADAAPESCMVVQDPSLPFTLELVRSPDQGGVCTGFSVTDKAGKLLYKSQGDLWTRGRFWPSADGRTVVMIYERIFANSRGGSDLEVYLPGGKTTNDVEAVVMFRDGKRLATYSWRDLMKRTDMVEESTSHTRWIASISPGYPKPLPATFRLVTTSFREHTFDTKTGKVSSTDSAAWKRCSVIAYGPVAQSGADYTMTQPAVVKGTKAKQLVFTLGKGVSLGPSHQLVCLESRGATLEATEVFRYLLNSLNP